MKYELSYNDNVVTRIQINTFQKLYTIIKLIKIFISYSKSSHVFICILIDYSLIATITFKFSTHKCIVTYKKKTH